jgi:hypothetical protein
MGIQPKSCQLQLETPAEGKNLFAGMPFKDAIFKLKLIVKSKRRNA